MCHALLLEAQLSISQTSYLPRTPLAISNRNKETEGKIASRLRISKSSLSFTISFFRQRGSRYLKYMFRQLRGRRVQPGDALENSLKGVNGSRRILLPGMMWFRQARGIRKVAR